MESLSPAQARVLELIHGQSCNVFLTGGGGVGKSHVIHTVVQKCRERGAEVAVCASTGVAADQIGGTTLHALLGLGLAQDPVDKLVKKAVASTKIRTTWRNINLLVIDEVSMLDPDFFTAVDAVAKAVRNNNLPFGGVQLLLSGDFFQLPPVSKKERDTVKPVFCFQTKAWQDAVHEVVELTEVFRQHGDNEFIQLLQRARYGDYTTDDVDTLISRVNVRLDGFEGIEPTRLYARRVNVDEVNATALAALGAEVESASYTATVHYEVGVHKNKHGGRTSYSVPAALKSTMQTKLHEAAQKYKQNAAAPETLDLKIGAQVMLLCNMNIEEGLVNGSRGVVVAFETTPTSGMRKMPVVQFSRTRIAVERFTWEYEVAETGLVMYRQVPLQLAWAVTIHKAQGLSLDCVELALDRSVFEYGQAYVALSRVRSLHGLRLTSFTPAVLQAHPLVKGFYASLNASSSTLSQTSDVTHTRTTDSATASAPGSVHAQDADAPPPAPSGLKPAAVPVVVHVPTVPVDRGLDKPGGARKAKAPRINLF